MARSRTLADMRSDVRLRADLVGNLFVTNSEIDEYINQSLAELYDRLVGARGMEYYAAEQVITTVGGTERYALPATHYETLYVELEYNGSRYRLGSYSLHERAQLLDTAFTGQTGVPRAFRVIAGDLSLLPVPGSTYTVRHMYAPACARLVNDGDTFDGVNGWEEYAIWRAVAYVRGKEDLDVSIAVAYVDRLGKRIDELAAFRAQQTTERITDTSRRGRWFDLTPDRWLPPA